jgi:hypothetical protein
VSEEEQAKADLDRYLKAFTQNAISICVAVEKRWGLYGYPPSVVTQILAAVANGEDHGAAEDHAIGADE